MNGTINKMKGLKLANFKSGQATKFITLSLLLFSTTPVWAGGGSGALGTAATEIKKYWSGVKTLILAVGGLVGLIGGLRIYNKWTNGDQDINKEIVGWGGACLFLVLVPTFIEAFFI